MDAERTEIYRLEIGAACAVCKLTFRAAEITAALDVQPNLNRKQRRMVKHWSYRIFRALGL